MNIVLDEIKDILHAAGMNRDIYQLFHKVHDGSNGYCAVGVIRNNCDPILRSWLYKTANLKQASCVECDEPFLSERVRDIIVHLNDVHRYDFITIANKLDLYVKDE